MIQGGVISVKHYLQICFPIVESEPQKSQFPTTFEFFFFNFKIFYWFFYFVFLPVLLRYNGHTALYKFKVKNITVWLTSWSDYHSKSHEYLSSNLDAKLKK